MAESGESQTAEALIREMAQLQGHACPECSRRLCAHEVLMSIALGCRNSPRCLPCLGSTFSQDVEFLRPLLIDYLHQRECYRIAWQWANQHENATNTCPAAQKAAEIASTSPAQRMPTDIEANAEWDAGDMACGDLVLELRLRLEAMAPGQTLKLCARDPGAPQDIPAWCRLTGHTALQEKHPTYWIKRKE